MPEYLAPGVYVEEVSFRSKSIEGVSTTTTAFIGPTRYGPVDLVPDVITSLVEFERIYGDRQQIVYDGSARHNFMWHAVRQFFENGGKRLYVARVFRTFAPLPSTPPAFSSPLSPMSMPPFPAG
jgi:phage tail sheath protein FI